MTKPTYIFLDLETTGVSPRLAKVISGGFYITDENHNIIDSIYLKCHIAQDKITKNANGWDIDNSPQDAQKVHGLDYYLHKQEDHPLDFCRKLYLFLAKHNTMLTIVYHANAAFDVRRLFSHFSLWSEKGYYMIQKYISRDLTENTMAMAREYNKKGSMGLSEALKYEKQIKKYDGYLTKIRKTPAKPEKIAEWTRLRNIAESQSRMVNKNAITFEGAGLAALCKGLNIELDHHDAMSDAKALIPIHKFLRQNL